MPDNDPLNPAGGCRQALLVTVSAAALTLILTGAAVFFLQARISSEARAFAASVADRVESTLNLRPEVRVEDLVVVESSGPTVELATAEATYIVRHSWSHTHFYSTKRLEIEAPFTAKAGFDFSETPLRITVEPRTRAIEASLPSPRLLSLEMGDPKIRRDEDGFWNKLTPADREEAFRELRRLAKEKAVTTGLLNQARAEANKLIEGALKETVTPADGETGGLP